MQCNIWNPVSAPIKEKAVALTKQLCGSNFFFPKKPIFAKELEKLQHAAVESLRESHSANQDIQEFIQKILKPIREDLQNASNKNLSYRKSQGNCLLQCK